MEKAVWYIDTEKKVMDSKNLTLDELQAVYSECHHKSDIIYRREVRGGSVIRAARIGDSLSSGARYDVISNRIIVDNEVFSVWYEYDGDNGHINVEVRSLKTPLTFTYGFTGVYNFTVRELHRTVQKSLSEHKKKEKQEKEEKMEARLNTEAKGQAFTPKEVILEEVSFELNTSGSLVDRYNQITSISSQITTNINAQLSLADNDELAKAFHLARKSVENHAVQKSGVSTFASKVIQKLPFAPKLKESIKTSVNDAKSQQSNIDYLFGLIHDKYEKIVEVGTQLQSSKAQFLAQIEELQKLSIETQEAINEYQSSSDVPMNLVSLDTKIKSSIQKTTLKLQKIEGAIIGVQATIIQLGSELPAHKCDLEDEMAIGGVLSSVDDYQEMYKSVVQLVTTITDITSDKTHKVIENLMDLQINDTHTVEYIQKQAQRGEKFTAMIADKSDKLAKKVTQDAKFINAIAKQTALSNINMPKLSDSIKG